MKKEEKTERVSFDYCSKCKRMVAWTLISDPMKSERG